MRPHRYPDSDWIFQKSDVDVPLEWSQGDGAKVLIGKHKSFPPNLCLLVDLSFVTGEFFNVSERKIVRSMTSERRSLRGDMNGGAMMYKDTNNEFHFRPMEHEQLVFGVLDKILQDVGCKPPRCSENRRTISLVEEIKQLALLGTVFLKPQRPHGDYTHKQLEIYRQAAGKCFKDCPYPWSFDMPLTEGGMSLLMYGQDLSDGHETIQSSLNKNVLRRIPVRLNVPFKYALLRR